MMKALTTQKNIHVALFLESAVDSLLFMETHLYVSIGEGILIEFKHIKVGSFSNNVWFLGSLPF